MSFSRLRIRVEEAVLTDGEVAHNGHLGVSENTGYYFGVLITRILLFRVLC